MKGFIENVKNIIFILNGVVLLCLSLRSCNDINKFVESKAVATKEKVRMMYQKRERTLLSDLQRLKSIVPGDGLTNSGTLWERHDVIEGGKKFQKYADKNKNYRISLIQRKEVELKRIRKKMDEL